MRIALVTDGIWPYVLGGMQKHSFYLCKYLAANKVNVDLFHFNNSTYDISLLQFFTAEERAYITNRVIVFPKSPSFPGHYLYDSYRYSRAVAKQVLAEPGRYDLIYTKGFTGWYLLTLPKNKRSTLPPVALNFHGYEMFQRAPAFFSLLQQVLLLRQPVKWLSRKADLVYSYGGKITGIVKSLGVREDRLREIPTGVVAATVADGIMPTPDITRFVFLGRYERRKGIEELNEAIRSLPPEVHQKAEFHFIGPIPQTRRLGNCKYHGEIRDADHLNRLLRGCDVLICPSWSEGMPNVILEAMAQGLAVIATNTGATSTLVHQGTGWLLASADPVLIGEAIVSAVNLPRAAMDDKKHSALRLIRSEFVWEKIVPRLLETFPHAEKQAGHG
jgi:glycosyltransferase involved in cell wall biosynthesis